MEIKKDILWRVYLSYLGIVLICLLIISRAFYIQGVQGSYWRSMSDSLHQRIVPLDAERGTIYSEDGEMLSTSIPFFDVYIDFAADGLREKNGKRFYNNIDSFSMALSGFFKDKSVADYKRDLQTAFKNKERYYLLKKNLSFDQYKEFRNFPLVRQGRNRSGVIAEINPKRLNPYGLLANRTIGLSRANAQNVGLERTYDTLLKGSTGQRLVRFISGGSAVPVEGYEIDPENGKDIITTLDVNIQDIAQTALMKMMLKSESQYGTCIVMETKSGKIKAIANLGRQKDGSYYEDYNYALRTTEPGSTIKLATLLSVLEEGTVTINDKVEVGSTGSAYVGVRNVTDAERAPQSIITVRECFSHSSNVGMSKLAYKAFATQPDKYRNYLTKFHLDSHTGIDLVGEENTVVRKLKKNKESLHAMVTMSFGYALEVSPLHTLMLYNAVANNGKMMKPYLVNRIQRDGVIINDFKPHVLTESICRPEVIKAARVCMEAVTTEGTAKYVFKNSMFPVAGKTGTAHVAGGKVKYGDGVYQASFAGYFPADNPQYSCIVVIKTRPHAAMHYGGQLAAPVFKEIADKLFLAYVNKNTFTQSRIKKDSTVVSYAGLTSDVKSIYKKLDLRFSDASENKSWCNVLVDDQRTSLSIKSVVGRSMPDLKGMGLKDALYIMENMGVKVYANGKGKIRSQSIEKGSEVGKGTVLVIELS